VAVAVREEAEREARVRARRVVVDVHLSLAATKVVGEEDGVEAETLGDEVQ
jgi:hypothetical protein